MSNWTNLIPSTARSIAYVVFGVISVGTGAVTTWYSTTTGAVPSWVTGVTAVLAYVGGALGFVAAGNTNVGSDPIEAEDLPDEYADDDYQPATDDEQAAVIDAETDTTPGKHAADVPAE